MTDFENEHNRERMAINWNHAVAGYPAQLVLPNSKLSRTEEKYVSGLKNTTQLYEYPHSNSQA